MKFEYPVALSGDEDKAPKFLKGASNRTGYFPVGRLNTWHGGIHFEGDRAIRAIADGKIIAFRVPKTYLTETVNGRTARYSNGFVLIQHEYESPKGQQLTFYSFYNHLLALEEMKGIKIPDVFKGQRYKVKATAHDSLKANGENGDKGALLRSEAKTGDNIVCLMSPNSSVEIAPESQGKKGWLKVVNYGPDKLEGWCHDTGLEKEAFVILEEKMCDEVKEVCMDVNAGTIVGFAGYNGFENQTAYRAAHVEVFSSDEAVKDFLNNAKKDGENEQKFVKFPKGTEFKTAIPKSVRKDSKVKLLAESTDQYQLVEVENIGLTVSDRDATLGEYKSKGNYYEFLADHSAKVSAFNEEAGGIAKIGDKVKLMEDANQVSQKSTREVEHINPAKGLVFWAKKDWIEKKVITLPAVAEPAAVAVEAEVGEGIDPVFANLPAARDLGVVTQPTVEVEPVTVEYDVINLDLSEVHLLNPEAEVSNNKLEVDVVIDLKKGKEYKDDSGKVWRLFDFSDYRADGTLAAYKGLVKEDDLKDRFSAYDWAKFGFRILEDANNDYIFDFKERSDFFKEVCKLVDEDKNGILEPHELQSALNNPYTADKLSKLVCKHHNEWAYGGKHLSGLMSAVEKVFQKGIDLEKDEDRKKNLEELKKERMEAFEAKVKHMSIWEDIVPKEKGFWSSWFEGLLATSPPTAPGYWTFKGTRWVFEKVKEYFSDEVPLKPFPANQPVVYHFHPIAFVEGMKRVFDVITLKIAKEIALKVSGAYEGVNPSYNSLADNFDGQGMSWGIIQYNFGQDTLGPLLLKMKSKNEQKFNDCFIDPTDLASLNIALEGSIQDQINWAIDMQNNHNDRWKDSFNNLAAVEEFQELQLEGVESYDNQALKIIEWMRSVQPNIMQNIELATFVALHDLVVQQWSITNAKDAILAKCNSNPPQNQDEFIRIVVKERGATASSPFRADCISRRLGILNKQATKITHSGYTSERTNVNFNLIQKGCICDL